MLPEAERVLFKNTPLRLVLGQIRFPLLLRFQDGAFLAPFQSALEGEYPLVRRERQPSLLVSPEGEVRSGLEALLRFSSRDSQWSVVLGESALTLEVRGYSSIDKFSSRFERVLLAAENHLGIKERSRLGLRYINEIRRDGATTLSDWSKLLNRELLGIAGTDLLDGPVAHMVQEFQVTRSDGLLAVRHGLLQGTIVVDPLATTSAPTGPFYLLDLDYYDGRQQTLNVKETTETFREYNDVMYRFFRWCLTETLFTAMEPQHVE